MAPGPRILYADDDENDQFFLRRAFRKLRDGVELHSVSDGVAAIEELQRSVPEVMLADVKMPRVSGFELLSWIRSQSPPLRDMPVIMLSSSPQPRDFAEAERLKANGYFVKPSGHLGMQALAESVMAFLNQPTAERKWKCPPDSPPCRSFPS